MTETNHDAGGKHIKHHFLCSPGLHAGGAGNHLRANLGDDCEICSLFEWRITIASDGNGMCSMAARIGQGSDREWSTSACRDSDHNITGTRFFLGYCALPELARVFVGFESHAECLQAARHHELHGSGVDIKCWRTFDRVQRGDAPAGAGSHVDEAPTFPKSVGN